MVDTVYPNMEPRDWLEIAERQIAYERRLFSHELLSADEVLTWLNKNCTKLSREVTRGDLAEIRKSNQKRLHEVQASKRKTSSLNSFQNDLITAIMSIVPLTAVTKHLVGLRFRSLAYHDVNPRAAEQKFDLKGIYVARRHSFSDFGQICRSAFWFDRDRLGRPIFKQKRVGSRSNARYQIRSRGFWFSEKQGYRFHGFSYEFDENGRESDLKVEDLKAYYRYDENYCINNDKDPSTLTGISPFILKNNGWSAVTKIILTKIPEFPEADERARRYWDKIEDTDHVGIYSPDSPEESAMLRLDYDGDLAPGYEMPVLKN